jgi:hypothetical protein
MKAANMPATKKVQRNVVKRANSGSCIRLFRRKITEVFYVPACFGDYLRGFDLEVHDFVNMASTPGAWLAWLVLTRATPGSGT